jgi:hypothetical protein
LAEHELFIHVLHVYYNGVIKRNMGE